MYVRLIGNPHHLGVVPSKIFSYFYIEKANKENYNCGNTFITEEKTNTSETINTNQDDDLNKLFAEIHLANSKMDNFLNEIDECLELNENINTVLENNKEPPKEEKK